MSGAKRYLEVERKFDVDAATQPPSFDGVVARVEHAETEQLDAVYFDTASRDLAINRITLRRRTGGADAGWHLKLPAGAEARTEVRLPLHTEADDVPNELLDVVLAIVRDRPVAPVARISTTRKIQLLHGADDAVIAEFCDDQVAAGHGPDGTTGEQRWREWELELVGAGVSSELLDVIGDRLLDAGAEPAGVSSKLARCWTTSPKSTPADPLHRGWPSRSTSCCCGTGRCEQTPGLGAPDAGDDPQDPQPAAGVGGVLRARRRRADLDELSELASDPRRRPRRRGAGREVRDALDGLPASWSAGRSGIVWSTAPSSATSAGLDTPLAAMRSERYFRLLDELEALIAEAPNRRRGDEPAPVTVDAAYKRVRKAAKKARRMPRATPYPTTSREAPHKIRKRAKQSSLHRGRRSAQSKVAEQAKSIQSLLGDHQDSVVSRDHLTAKPPPRTRRARTPSPTACSTNAKRTSRPTAAAGLTPSWRGCTRRFASRRLIGADELACKPDSVPRSTTRGGDHPSGHTVAGCLERSTRRLGRAALRHLRDHAERGLLDLASGGVCQATPVTRNAGALLPHRFTLTTARVAVCSLWHFPASHLGLPLAITLLCEVRTFLDSALQEPEPRPPGQLVRANTVLAAESPGQRLSPHLTLRASLSSTGHGV